MLIIISSSWAPDYLSILGHHRFLHIPQNKLSGPRTQLGKCMY